MQRLSVRASSFVPPAVVVALVAALAVAGAFAPRESGAFRYVKTADPGYPRIKYPDSLVSVNDRCIVSGTPLSTMIRPTYVNGKAIGYCCSGCPRTFVRDPEAWLADKKIALRCPVEPTRPAVLDVAHRAQIGKDWFFFSSPAAKKKFEANPLAYVKALSDPVTHVRFKPTATSFKMEYRGNTFYFVDPASRALFAALPDSFATEKGGNRDGR